MFRLLYKAIFKLQLKTGFFIYIKKRLWSCSLKMAL